MSAIAMLKEIPLKEAVDILSVSSALQSIDLGFTIIHLVEHPIQGRLILTNDANGRATLGKT
jgi:hypothetical protein